jgi:hypothetical protein
MLCLLTCNEKKEEENLNCELSEFCLFVFLFNLI